MEKVLDGKALIKELIDLCVTKIVKKRCCMSKPVFCYYEQLEYILSYNYNAVKFEAPNSHDGHNVPMMFFPSHNKHMIIDKSVIEKHGKNVTITFDEESKDSINCTCRYNNKPTVILCNPNALCYEQMVNYPHNYWLKYFMNKGNNVVVWNYRCYGSAKGTPTPYNIKRDGEAVVEFCITTLKLKGRLGVYGRSLGGIVACHLGRHVRGIDLLIADRTLCNFETLTKRKMYGKFIHYAFNFFTFGWEVDNDVNYLESQVPCKIMTCDPSDDVIDIYSSLYSGVALRYFERKQGYGQKVEAIKHKLFFEDTQSLYNALKEFFAIYEKLTYALKQDDKLIVMTRPNKELQSMYVEEIKPEPISSNKKQIEKSRKSRDLTKRLIGRKQEICRHYLMRHFHIGESELQNNVSDLYERYIKPFRNAFA